MYPKSADANAVVSSPSFPQIEQGILQYWKDDDTFRASVENREPGDKGANEFVFYDGPPFANGLPHYGHLLTGYVKDIIPRYRTMRGDRVERRFGWDTHGLPAELEAERQLGIKGRGDVLGMGIDKFNDACRQSVLAYTKEWEEYVTRQARWVDFDNDYKTLNVEYMESVLWAFKSLHDKGYVYEGFRVLPYCWVDETPLSNHELRMDDDVYQMRQDPALTVGFRLETGEILLAWTTTPWTLPSNLACAVGPDIEYVTVDHDGEKYVLAQARLAAYQREFGDDVNERVVETMRGADLVGRRYEPLFDYLTDTEKFGTANAWRVVDGGPEVSTDDGTGVVHMAPAYGEVDQAICEAAGITTVLTVDEKAQFTSAITDYAGQQVFEANKQIIADLKAAGKVLRHETYDHTYPHCWRCRNPLIYRAVSSWFVEVTAFKDRMVELNQQINWVPGHIKDGQFGKWLSNARDWSISRNRFWGSPIPVWRSDDPNYPRIDVYGSLADLEADFGQLPRDEKGEVNLHRPFIDELTRPNPDDPSGRSTMRRVSDVLDVWFDSGSMPFAQVHYPFDNADWFEHHYPGDFIVEYIGQTRGWFYTLHILATALFDRPAFSNCISHGIVLGNDGQKMSKSLRNYPDVNEVFDRDGADAMRWFLMSSPILRGGNLIVTEGGVRDSVRHVLLPLWSTWYFFALYANSANNGSGYEAKLRYDSDDVLDRYILAATGELAHSVAATLDDLDVAGACERVRSHLDMLTNWYVRRSRQRFWDEDEAAFDTLYTALESTCRVVAPLLPLVTEEIWRGLTGGRSVHLEDWPDSGLFPDTSDLVHSMNFTREICSAASSLRKARNLRVRLPLPSLTVVAHDVAGLEQLGSIIADEVNVQNVTFVELGDDAAEQFGISQKLTVNARAAGPRLGKQVQQAIKGSKTGDWSVDADGAVSSGGIALQETEYTLETVVGDDSDGVSDQAVTVLPGGGFVVLDTAVTPELAQIGLVRDVIRVVQQTRKDLDLNVSDRIRLTVTGAPAVFAAVSEHQDLLVGEVLAAQVGASGNLEDLPEGQDVVVAEVGEGHPVRVKVERM